MAGQPQAGLGSNRRVAKEIYPMKALMLVLVSVAALSGCAIVPAYGPPGYYAPAPLVVAPYYGYGYGYRGGYRRW